MAMVVIEGADGAGKTSLVERIEKRMRELGENVMTAREPGGCDSANELRDITKRQTFESSAQMLIMSAARIESVEKGQIHDWLEARVDYDSDHTLLCDRYDGSTAVYQKFRENPNIEATYWQIADTFNFPVPNLYIFVDVSFEVSVERRGRPSHWMGREYTIEQDVLERIVGTKEKFDKVRDDYNHFLAQRLANNYIPSITVDTSELTEDEVFENVWAQLNEYLKL